MSAKVSGLVQMGGCWLVVQETSRSGSGKVGLELRRVLMVVQPDADFECIAVMMEHSQDVKTIAWHPKEEVDLC